MKTRLASASLALSLTACFAIACGDDTADANDPVESGDDDSAGAGDDDEAGDDDTAGDDDSEGDDDAVGDDDAEGDDDEAPADDDGAADDDAPAEGSACDDVEFSINMEAEGEEGAIVVVLVDASPAPPMRYENDWRVEFRDAEGAVLEDVEIQMVEPFMPEHNHDGTFPPTVEAADEPGQFDITKINLWMPGSWEVRFSVSSESAGDDYAVFNVCIAE